MMLVNPTVGQWIALSREGYSRLKLDSPEAHQAAKRMQITQVSNVGHIDKPIWDIRVDNPYINYYMTDQNMFNLIEDVK